MTRPGVVVFAGIIVIGTQFLPAGANHDTSVTPILDCVEVGSDGTLTGWFGYHSEYSTVRRIPEGEQNYFFPGSNFRYQPFDFHPGTHDRVFVTTWLPRHIPELTWNLDGHVLRVTVNSVKCGADKISWHGAWKADMTYFVNDAVSHNGSSWLAVRQNTGVAPVEGGDWNLMAARGEPGPAATGSGFTPIVPVRIADTRPGQPIPHNAISIGPFQPWESRTISVAGPIGPPQTQRTVVPRNATAVTFNVAVTNTAAGGYLTIFPADASRPLASNLNWARGQTIANGTTVKLGTMGAAGAGQISIYNGSPGTTDVVLDVSGFYT